MTPHVMNQQQQQNGEVAHKCSTHWLLYKNPDGYAGWDQAAHLPFNPCHGTSRICLQAITAIDLTQHSEVIKKQWQAPTKQACVNALPSSITRRSLIDACLV
jgi:hypothetical protein